MKFFSKKDKNSKQVDTENEYIENEDQDDYAVAVSSSQNRPKTSQPRAEPSFTNRNKNIEEEYDDEKDFEDDEFFDDELDDDFDGDDQDFNAKYRREMKALKDKMKPQRDDKLSRDTQKILHETFDNFYEKESETMINMIEESRDDIKNSVVELMREQQTLKDDLNRLTNGRYSQAKKENVVSLSLYLKRKRGEAAFSTPGVSAASTTSMGMIGDQHLSDKMAVEKYMKKKERQKIAESNRLTREKTSAELETETKAILEKLQSVDISKEKERERQMEKIKMKLKNKNVPQKNDQEVANEIMDQYNDAKLAIEREKQNQQERIRQRLMAVKDAEGKPREFSREFTNSEGFKKSAAGKVPTIDI